MVSPIRLLQAGVCQCLRRLYIQHLRGSSVQRFLRGISQSVWREGSRAFPSQRTAGHGHRKHQLWLEGVRAGKTNVAADSVICSDCSWFCAVDQHCVFFSDSYRFPDSIPMWLNIDIKHIYSVSFCKTFDCSWIHEQKSAGYIKAGLG